MVLYLLNMGVFGIWIFFLRKVENFRGCDLKDLGSYLAFGFMF